MSTVELSDAAAHLRDLQQLAGEDDQLAADAACTWMLRGADLRGDRSRTGAANWFSELFALGSPPRGADGSLDGALLLALFGHGLDRPFDLVRSVWTPWLGKQLDAAAGTGVNRVTPGFTWVVRAVWPGYALRRSGRQRLGFDFVTRIEAGVVVPMVDVLVIDYSGGRGNPRRIVSRIRDELVEIVPGVYLGRALWRTSGGHYVNLGYFMLRRPAG